MKHIRTSMKAVIIEDGRVLLTKNRNQYDGEFYLAPGGGQEHGETAHDTLRRECREELGCDVLPGPLLFVREYLAEHYTLHCSVPDLHQVEMMFACTLAPGAQLGGGTVPDNWQVGVEWVPLADLDNIVIYPAGLRKALRDPEHTPVYWGEDL